MLMHANEHPAGTRTNAAPVKTRVLVIDDDPATLQLVGSVLEANGYQCLTAPNAEQALTIVESSPQIAIAICDINMPGMGGILFLERINTLVAPHVLPPRVIFLTAHPRLDFAVAGLRLGAVDFLTKPVRPKELLSAVVTAVQRVQRDRANVPNEIAAVAQQAQALAATLKGWAQAQAQPDPRGAVANPGELALLGMEHLRRLRRSVPPLSELDDVAWDLLLELMRAEKNGQRLSVSSLSISIDHVSSTTALRRIQELVKAGHIVRVPDPTDARRDFVSLPDECRAILEQYVDRVGRELAAAASLPR
jgi:CheY-like chemotaxis protein/DNA-binding MarR family transcriptional regulator